MSHLSNAYHQLSQDLKCFCLPLLCLLLLIKASIRLVEGCWLLILQKDHTLWVFINFLNHFALSSKLLPFFVLRQRIACSSSPSLKPPYFFQSLKAIVNSFCSFVQLIAAIGNAGRWSVSYKINNLSSIFFLHLLLLRVGLLTQLAQHHLNVYRRGFAILRVLSKLGLSKIIITTLQAFSSCFKFSKQIFVGIFNVVSFCKNTSKF